MKLKTKLKGFYLVISSIFISLFHTPFAFARPATNNKSFLLPHGSLSKDTINSTFIPSLKSIYDSLHLSLSGLSEQAFLYAKKGLGKLIAQGKLMNDSIISIADFSQPSTEKRLYILDLKNYKVLFNTFVAHGKNSGRQWANSFSNQMASFKSSPGFYITGDTYTGENGYSLKLEGVEKGINDNASHRSIVVHGADYATTSFIVACGYLGRSWGCPAVPANEATPIINTIKNGTCLFIYNPNQSYLLHSPILSRV
jgi:hypothetical protein